jgi:hypothetical protein
VSPFEIRHDQRWLIDEVRDLAEEVRRLGMLIESLRCSHDHRAVSWHVSKPTTEGA